MATKTRRFFVNAICGLVYGKERRHYVRTVLTGNMRRNIRFVRENINEPVQRIRVRTGYRGRNIVIIANNKWVFKFTAEYGASSATVRREKRIVDALRDYSPVYVPQTEILEMHDGDETILVRRYECVPGKTIRDMSRKQVLANINKLAPQMAAALYAIGCADPVAIRDLKACKTDKTGYMTGWCQGDICDNFMIDTKTMKLVGYIDWEDARFADFAHMLKSYHTTPARELMAAVAHEYDKIWKHNHKKKASK